VLIPLPDRPFPTQGRHIIYPSMLQGLLRGAGDYPHDLAEQLTGMVPKLAQHNDWESLHAQGYNFIPGPPHPASLITLLEQYPERFAPSRDQQGSLRRMLDRQGALREMVTGPHWIVIRPKVTTSTIGRHFGGVRAITNNHVRLPRAAEMVWVAIVSYLLARHDFLWNERTFTGDRLTNGEQLVVGTQNGRVTLGTSLTREQAPDLGVLLVHDRRDSEPLRLSA